MPSIWIRALFVLAITSRASAQTVPTIGLYADPGGTDCNVVTALGTPVTAYVVLVPRISPTTLTEARIRVQLEFPSVVVSAVVPNALATLATGNPFTSPPPGATLRIELCPTATPVVLYTVTLTRTTGSATEVGVETFAEWTTCSLGTFTTRSVTKIDHQGSPSLPANPTPEDGATVASACITQAHQELAWSGRIESTVCRTNYWRVYFGTSSNPPFVWENYSFPGFDAGRLSSNTTYYWRVETVVDNFGDPDTILRGPLWRFTTGSPPESHQLQACPTTCETSSECPATCLFTSDPTFSSQCSNGVSGSYSTGRECGSGHSVQGIGSFDRSWGMVSAHVTTDAQCGGGSIDVTCADRFWLDGPESSEPIAFSAYFGFDGSGGCFFGALQEGTGPATFVPPAEPQQYHGALELRLRHTPGDTFVLRYGVMVSAPPPYTGYANGNLTFPALPAGYRIMSCVGYTDQGGQGITPSSWSRVKTLFR